VVWSTLPAVGCNLRSGGQALMSWAVSNARVEPKGNAIVITKQASGAAKIDPANGRVQRGCLDVGKPRVVTAEHLCDLGRELMHEGLTHIHSLEADPSPLLANTGLLTGWLAVDL
jgi:hypothetical protein